MDATFLDRSRLFSRLDLPSAMRSRPGIELLETELGDLRARRGPAPGQRRVVFAADGPNAIEHYDQLFELLRGRADVTVLFTLQAYARAIEDALDRLILPQAPSEAAMLAWGDVVDPRRIVRTPGLGQIAIGMRRQAIAERWYRFVLPAEHRAKFSARAKECFELGGAFCLASLMQQFLKTPVDRERAVEVPVTIVWGPRDRSHRQTDPHSACPQAELVTFPECGHSPELEDPARFIDTVLMREET